MSSRSLSSVVLTGLAVAATALASLPPAAAQRSSGFDADERAALLAGELVRRDQSHREAGRMIYGGASWQPVVVDWTRYLEEPVDPHLYDVAVSDGGVITIAGEYGLILRSADHGKTWVSVHRGEASIFDIAMRPDGTGYAVGQNGLVMTSSDGGNTWRDLPTGSEAVLLGVWSAPDGHVIVAGMRETLESRDGGATWKRRTDGDFATAWYSALAAPANGGLVLVGHTGRIVRIDS